MPYGNDFSSTQGAALSEQAARQAGLQSAFGHLIGTIQSMREQRNVEAQRGMQQQQFQEALKQRAYENEIQRQQQEVANRKLDIQNAVSQGYLKLGQDQLAMQKGGGTPAQIRDREFITNRAAADADQGMFDSPEDVISKYPTVQPEMAVALHAHSVDARQRANDAYTFGQNAAGTLNRLNDVNSELKELDAKHSGIGGWFRSNDAEKGKQLREEQTKLNNAKNLLQSNKNFSQLVTFDPSTGNYINSASPPRFGKSPVPPTRASVYQPDNSDGADAAGVVVPQPAVATGPAPGLSAQSSPTPTPPSPMSAAGNPGFAARVNNLIQNQNLDPVSAKRQALAEMMSGQTPTDSRGVSGSYDF